jgi:peptidoglycan hydrolase-like protein with peptidoglycan-binding domain
MALQSKLFKQDAKLQACLLQDAAHVTPGARGDHVGKIQIALNALGDEVIDAGEIKANTYGPSTASAVLAYKRKRKIINFSYQTQADNIVGRMTIDSLDKEMQKLEQPPLAINTSCPWRQKGLS